ncbi:MAG: hypothetical protein ABJK39_10135 [Hyphomicrobiales bacterium]
MFISRNISILMAGVFSAAIIVPVTSSFSANDTAFCQENHVETARCGAAVSLLRKLLLPEQPNEKQTAQKPVKKKTAPSKRVEKKQNNSTEAAETEAPVKVAPIGFIPIPKLRAKQFDPTQAVLAKPELGESKPTKVEQTASVTKANYIIPFPTPRPKYRAAPSQQAAQTTAQATKVSAKGCLDPSQVADPDIRGQRKALSSSKYCITETRVNEGGLNWKLHVIKNTKRPGPLFVIPHDNENSAFPSAIYGLAKYGGTLVAVESGERRVFKGQDPNRNFGTTRSAAAACPKQRAPAPKYTNAIMQHRKSGQPIIALHSNSNGWSGNGGSGTISINRNSRVMRPFITSIARSRRLADEDTLIVIASTKPPGKDRRQARALEHFTKKAGVNVIYEYVKPSQNDCSLSNYVVLNNLGSYFNVEVENGDVKTQKNVLDIVMDYVR